MNAEGQLLARAHPAADGPLMLLPHREEPHRQTNLAQVVHRNLRGRYALVITLSTICALGCAAAGYLLPLPRYRAEALVRIQPVMPRVLYQSEESTLQPMFASFVNTQASLLQHSRVQLKAMSSPAWRQLGRPSNAEIEEQFRKQLTVRTNRDTPELIFVSFSDVEARAALVAVQEVINSYQELFGGAESKSVREMQVSLLTTRKQSFETQRRDLENRLRATVAEFESDDLVRLSDHYLTQSLTLDGKLAERAMQLAEMGVDPSALPAEAADAAPGAAPVPATPPSPPTPQQIAATDPVMARLLTDQANLRNELERLKSTYSDAHRTVQRLRSDLAATDRLIAARTDEWIANPVDAGPPVQASATPTRRELIEGFVRLRQQTEAYKARAQAINKAKVQVDDLSREINRVQNLLDETNQRLDQIGVESKVQDRIGRIEVILPDSPPSTPNDDPRRKFAAMGLVGGGALPIGLFLLLGMLDRRFRFADQAGDIEPGVNLLGVLPHIAEQSTDPEEIAAAVHTVHHIRTRLGLSGPARKVFAITSPLAGEGKTSLALSLGISYASAGSKTLLVDFDFVGRALTSRLGVSIEQGLGHSMVYPGGELPIVASAVRGLSLLATGKGDVRLQSRVTPEMFASLLTELRTRYDMIIIDTGPILGSIEANICSAAADGVILVAGRGTHSAKLREAVGHLTQLGARVTGLVFNRAQSADFKRSSVASVSARSYTDGTVPRPDPSRNPIPGADKLDSLARSMAHDMSNNDPTS